MTELKDADEHFLARALAQASAAAAAGEVPVGAALASVDGTLFAEDHNRILERHDPTAHAEMLVLRKGTECLHNERLTGTTLYVTLEPCAMCAGAVSLARVARLVYVAADPKGGAVVHGPRFFGQPTCHHRPEIIQAGDPMKAGDLLKAFFRARRA